MEAVAPSPGYSSFGEMIEIPVSDNESESSSEKSSSKQNEQISHSDSDSIEEYTDDFPSLYYPQSYASNFSGPGSCCTIL